ncbi:MAG: hypothetical protein ACFFDN_31880 [Candidatus Hodarchaeota archaeon]
MLDVDLIVPWLSSFKNIIRVPSRYNLKHRYWFPVWLYKNELKKKGVKIRFLNRFNLKYSKFSKIIGIDSRYPNLAENLIDVVKKLRDQADYLLWFDMSDSSSRAYWPALKYFDRFFKRTLLKDLSLYRKKYYKRSIFVDYYKRNYNTGGHIISPSGHDLDPKYHKKIALSWNLALCDYRFSGKLSEYLCGFSRKYNLKFYKPNLNRKLLFSANFNISRSSHLVYFQREKLGKFLKKKYKSNDYVSIGRIQKKKYLQTQRSSKAIFSPFGWGEVCYRDIETFLAGAALIKPNMEHIETWPNLFKKNETYIPISWKIEDWDKEIPEILSNETLLLKVAKTGQNQYKKLFTREGRDFFCDRFIQMVTPE